jgi:hypothetical protein
LYDYSENSQKDDPGLLKKEAEVKVGVKEDDPQKDRLVSEL